MDKIKNRTDRNRLLNSLPNDLRATVVALENGIEVAEYEHDTGAVTDGQMEAFWELIRFTTQRL
jgi:hypothetical protein